MPQEISTMGIDAALRKTGLCHLKGSSFALRLVEENQARGGIRLVRIRDRVVAAINVFKPQLIAIEGYSYGSEGRWFDLGEVGGVLKVEFILREIPYIIVPPKSLKRFATGNGGASKKRMIREVEKQYGIEVEGCDDLADAAALAKFAYVFLTGDSVRRSELEATRNFKESLRKQPKKKKKLRVVAV